MADCDELSVSLAPTGRPSGCLTGAARPQSQGFCRAFNFTPPAPAQEDAYVTQVDFDPIYTQDGDAFIRLI